MFKRRCFFCCDHTALCSLVLQVRHQLSGSRRNDGGARCGRGPVDDPALGASI
jgi:hypothetical protein